MLKGKTAFITGTNRGIGKAILEEFAKNGANIIAHARKETPEFREMISAFSQKYGVDIIPVYFDMADKEDMRAAIKELHAKKMVIDVLVNNAGMMHNASFQMSSEKALRNVFDVNFFATFFLTQLISNFMIKQRKGSIVNIASMAALDCNEGKAIYGASKAAMIAMSGVIAKELGQLGIRSNCVAPGVIDTDILQTMPANELEKAKAQTSMKRFGLSNEVAGVVVFLASEKASYINGQVIRVDGGM